MSHGDASPSCAPSPEPAESPDETRTAQLTTSVVRASLVNAKISTPTSLAPSSASGTTVQVHNTAGKPRDRRKQLGFLSRENYYVSDPPVRAGFSIFYQTKFPLSSIAKPGSEGSVQSDPVECTQRCAVLLPTRGTFNPVSSTLSTAMPIPESFETDLTKLLGIRYPIM